MADQPPPERARQKRTASTKGIPWKSVGVVSAIIAATGAIVVALINGSRTSPATVSSPPIIQQQNPSQSQNVQIGLNEDAVGRVLEEKQSTLRSDLAEMKQTLATLQAQLAPKQPAPNSDDCIKLKAVELFNAGVDLYEKSEYHYAERKFIAAVELNPDFAEAHNNLGATLIGQGRTDEAIAAYRRAVEIKPDDTYAHSNLGVALIAEASAQLAVSVRSVGETIVHQMRHVSDVVLPENRKIISDETDSLEAALGAHVAVMNAVADYAHSLQEVTQAGNAGAESARRVADAALKLAETANFAVGQTGAIVGDEFVTIYEQIARAQARARLIECMNDLQPAVESIMNLMSQSLEDVRAIVLLVAQIQLNALTRGVGDELGFRLSLIAARDKLYEKGWANLDDAQKAELAAVEKAIAETDKWHAPYDEQMRAVMAERNATLEAISDASQGMRDWGATHVEFVELIDAIEKGSDGDPRELLILIEEIGDLVERMRESRAPVAPASTPNG